MIDLSISLVSCNSKDILYDCLNSIYKNVSDLKIEILLSDNGSKDGTVDLVRKKFPQVKLTPNTSNLLFTKAHNQNLKSVHGKYFLVLNEDTIISPQALKKMVMFMESHSNVGLVSCRQIDENSRTINTSERFPHPVYEIFEASFVGRFIVNNFPLKRMRKMLENFRYREWDRKTTRQVDVIPGSFFLGRRSLLKTVGYFDERLRLFYEEPDYCQRARKKGYLTYHVGNVTIRHLMSKAIKSNLTPLMRYQIAEHDRLNYYKKYFGFVWYVILWFLFRPNWLYWKLQSLCFVI